MREHFDDEMVIAAEKRAAGILVHTPDRPQWRGGREKAREKQAIYADMVVRGYRAVYAALEIEVTSTGARIKGHDKTTGKRPNKIKLVAIKRIAQKLYADAVRIDGILHRDLENSKKSEGK